MDSKKQKIVEAAMDVFSRYGVRRTTMGDIADAVGISRQTLYTSYANKESVLIDVVCFSIESTLATIQTDWAKSVSIGDKLDVFFEHSVVAYYDKIQQMPDSDDLIAAVESHAAEEIKVAERVKTDALAKQFDSYAGQLKKAGISPKELADMVLTSSRYYKYAADDKKHLMRLLNSLKASVLALIAD